MNKNIKNEKRYDFSTFGYVRMLWDLRQEKLNKVNGIISLAIIIGMFAFGILSKELFIIIIANKGIGKVTSWLV